MPISLMYSLYGYAVHKHYVSILCGHYFYLCSEICWFWGSHRIFLPLDLAGYFLVAFHSILWVSIILLTKISSFIGHIIINISFLFCIIALLIESDVLICSVCSSMLLGNFLDFLALVCMPTISSSGSNFLSCFMANFFIGVYDFCFIAFSSNSLNGFLECEIYWYQDKDKEEFKRVVATPYWCDVSEFTHCIWWF